MFSAPQPNLGLIHRANPPFSKCTWRKGVTFSAPTHAPQLLVTHLGSVSTFLSYHARGSPLDVAPSWVVSVPGFPSGGVGTSRVRLLPTSTGTVALKPPFSFSLSSFWAVKEARALLVMSWLGYVLFWWCLYMATPFLGDALTWRCLKRSTCWLPFPSLGLSSGPTMCWLWLWLLVNAPGRYTIIS